MALDTGEYADSLNILQNELGFGILTAVALFGPLNINQLSKRLGRSPSTIVHQLKNLLEDNFIALDATKTSMLSGKYYQLTLKAREILDEITKSMEKLEREIASRRQLGGNNDSQILTDRKFATAVITAAKGMASFSKNMTSFLMTYIEDNLDSLKVSNGRLQIRGQDLGRVFLHLDAFNIPDEATGSKLEEIFRRFTNEILQLVGKPDERQREGSKSNEKPRPFFIDSSDNYFLYLFCGPIKKP